jgi:hypothetical protein
MKQTRKELQEELIFYLNLYLNKRGLRMKPVLRSIKHDLKKDFDITPRQFKSVVKFLEREIKFINRTRDEITNYFRSIIIDYQYRQTKPKRPKPITEKPLHNLETFFEEINADSTTSIN